MRTSSSTGVADRRASAFSAGSRPPSVSTAGWMPRAISRSSSRTSIRAPPIRDNRARRSVSSGGVIAAAPRTSSPSETSRCWAPSCRSRSIRRRTSSAAATIRAREASTSPSRSRCEMSWNATTAPRPPSKSTGADEYETTTRVRSLRTNQSCSTRTVSPVEEGPEKRTFLCGVGRPVKAQIVDAVVTRLSQQLLLRCIAKNAEGGRVEEGDSSLRVNDVQSVRNGGDGSEEGSFLMWLRYRDHSCIVARLRFASHGAGVSMGRRRGHNPQGVLAAAERGGHLCRCLLAPGQCCEQCGETPGPGGRQRAPR